MILVIAERKISLLRVALIDIYKGENEMRGKLIVRSSKRDNKKRARGSVIELYCDKGYRTNVNTIFKNLGPFAKPKHEVF